MTDEKPTYEDIVAYAQEAGLIGKIDTVRFYDYYAKQEFMFRGAIMDWKGKMREWAKTQTKKIIPNAKETAAQHKYSKIDVNLLNQVQKAFGLV